MGSLRRLEPRADAPRAYRREQTVPELDSSISPQPTPPLQYLEAVDLDELSRLCIKKFGLEPRRFQLECARATLMGRDCVINIPTGGGKTLAFFLALLLMPDGIVLVVSPLTALMLDQASPLPYYVLPKI